ncbi:MAG: hypothetical protein HQK99_13775 [Nitrospirae bacterium]|nr:hypothetical protein [Nitrospirota bacterium]
MTHVIDKRKGPDFIVKSISWVVASCWLVIFVAWSYVYYAMPEHLTIFDPHGIYRQARTYWDIHLLKDAFIAINVLLLISIAGMVESILRHHRKTDRLPKTLIIMIIMSLVGMFVVSSLF